MQVAMMESSRTRFLTELNEHLAGGCKIVPGTFAVQTYHRTPGKTTPPWCVLPNGVALDTVYFVVLELPEGA